MSLRTPHRSRCACRVLNRVGLREILYEWRFGDCGLFASTYVVGHAGLIGRIGEQATTIEMAVAFGVTYVVLGGILFVLVASFRSLSDQVDSFFALLIPEPTGIPGSRRRIAREIGIYCRETASGIDKKRREPIGGSRL